jgi:streptogramin lyase
MAYQQAQTNITLKAGADLSSSQYFFVKIDANGDVVLAGNGENAIGVLQNAPASGEAANIAVAGVSKVIIGDTTSLDSGVVISSDANGKATLGVSTDFALAILIEDTTANDDVVSCLIQKTGAI